MLSTTLSFKAALNALRRIFLKHFKTFVDNYSLLRTHYSKMIKNEGQQLVFARIMSAAFSVEGQNCCDTNILCQEDDDIIEY